MRNKQNLNDWQKAYYHKRKNEPEYKLKRQKSARRYYSLNKKRYAENRKKYFEKNKDYYRQYRREYRWNNPVGIYSVVMGGAKRRNLLVEITKEQFVSWYVGAEKTCFYCHRTTEQVDERNDYFAKRSKRLTVDRLNNDTGYSIDNIVLCCYRCNMIKGDFFTKDEMLEIGKIIQKKCIN